LAGYLSRIALPSVMVLLNAISLFAFEKINALRLPIVTQDNISFEVTVTLFQCLLFRSRASAAATELLIDSVVNFKLGIRSVDGIPKNSERTLRTNLST